MSMNEDECVKKMICESIKSLVLKKVKKRLKNTARYFSADIYETQVNELLKELEKEFPAWTEEAYAILTEEVAL